jgi:hypothetical protein
VLPKWELSIGGQLGPVAPAVTAAAAVGAEACHQSGLLVAKPGNAIICRNINGNLNSN